MPDSSHQNALSSARNGPREERGGAIGNRSPKISQGATFVELPGEERAEHSIEDFAQYFNLLFRMVVKSGGNWKRPVNRMYAYNFQV